MEPLRPRPPCLPAAARRVDTAVAVEPEADVHRSGGAHGGNLSGDVHRSGGADGGYLSGDVHRSGGAHGAHSSGRQDPLMIGRDAWQFWVGSPGNEIWTDGERQWRLDPWGGVAVWTEMGPDPCGHRWWAWVLLVETQQTDATTERRQGDGCLSKPQRGNEDCDYDCDSDGALASHTGATRTAKARRAQELPAAVAAGPKRPTEDADEELDDFMSDVSIHSEDYDDPSWLLKEDARRKRKRALIDREDFYYTTPQGLWRHKSRRASPGGQDIDLARHLASLGA